jgi:hypothetical protein
MKSDTEGTVLLIVVCTGAIFLALAAIIVASADAVSCYRFVPAHEHSAICDEHVERAYRVMTASVGFISASVAGIIAILRL